MPQGMSVGALSASAWGARPWLTATVIAGIYAVVSVTYIFFSSNIAADRATDLAHLEAIERAKGIAFVLLSSGVIFALVAVYLRRLDRQQELLQQQRSVIEQTCRHADAGLFASSVAHDLNNILVVNFACLDELEADATLTARQRELLVELHHVSEQVRDYAQGLQSASGSRLRPGLNRVDVARVVGDAARLARSHGKVRRCDLQIDLPESLLCDADASALHRLVLNLILNAADATEGGSIRLSLTGDADGFVLAVDDDGPGVPEEERGRILDPFYTTKEDGTGLGLLTLKDCAEVHRGRYAIEGSELGGARFVLDCRANPQLDAASEREPNVQYG